jgi:vacuolar-type H+-ATPase subunit I/STV1
MPEGQQAEDQESEDRQQQDDAQSQADGEEFDRERAMATIAKLRGIEKQSKAQAKELETLRAKVKEQDDAKLSEQEKLQSRIKELESQQAERDRQYRALSAENALVSAFSAAGARHIDLLVSRYAARVEFDASGQPENVEALLTEAKKDKADLFRAQAGSADGGAGNGQREKAAGGTDMNKLIRQFAGRT